ncbi:MAG: alpha/beta fold hydrolase [Ornithinibacter sp.]
MDLPRPLALIKLMVVGQRQPITRTPADVDLACEEVAFTATDGVPLEGWFVPAEPTGAVPGPVVVFVHGWLWNRAGNVAGLVPFDDRDVDFLPTVRAVHDAGMHVLMFDLSNHGRSGSRMPMTFGAWEARDLIGAMSYVRGRPEVDPLRVGVLGTSMGGNTALEAAPYCQPIPAMLLIQPNRAGTFIARFARDHLGKQGPAILHPTDWCYAAARAPRPSRADPGVAAALLTDTVAKYVQGTGDPWGTMSDVEAMVEATPRTLPLVRYPSTGRYEGYAYITEYADDVAAFFVEHL